MIRWLTNSYRALESLSDDLLVGRAKRGNRDAFGHLYLKYLDMIYRYIYVRVNQDRQTAEDLAETVFFKAWEHIGTYKKEGGLFKSWLFRIAHNAVIDQYRRNRGTVSLDENLHDNKTTHEEELIRDDESRELVRAMDQLTDEQKQVLTLKYMEDMTNSEIANITRKNEVAVRALQSRALKKLRSVLS